MTIRRSMVLNRSRLPELQRPKPIRKTLGNIESDHEDCPFKPAPAKGLSQLRKFKAPEVSREAIFPKGKPLLVRQFSTAKLAPLREKPRKDSYQSCMSTSESSCVSQSSIEGNFKKTNVEEIRYDLITDYGKEIESYLRRLERET